MANEEIDFSDPEQLVKVGALNVLALGYRGIEMWRQQREPLTKNDASDEKEA